MNIKAEAFQQYLEASEARKNVFRVGEVPDDGQHTAVFRSQIQVEGQQLPTVVILDDSVFSMIRVSISPKAVTESNELAVLRLANQDNLKYKPFKLYVDANGALIMDMCVVTMGKTADDFTGLGDEIYAMLEVVIDYLNENYRTIMKAIWGDSEEK